jgi:hypothetical protein
MSDDCGCCAEALVRPSSVIFHASCKECSARALANGPHFFESQCADRLTDEYRKALVSVFGDGWRDGHSKVRMWSDRIRQAAESVKHS